MLLRTSDRELGVLLCRQVFNDQEKLRNESGGQTLPSSYNQWMKLMNGKSIRLVLLPCVNECFKEPLKLPR